MLVLENINNIDINHIQTDLWIQHHPSQNPRRLIFKETGMLIKNVNVHSKDLGRQNNFAKDKAGGLTLPDLKFYTDNIINILIVVFVLRTDMQKTEIE